MKKVYVIHDTGYFDLADAAKFGDLKPIFVNKVSMLDGDNLLDTIENKIKDFKEGDYILCIGSPILILLTGFILGEMDINEINYLTWDKKYKTYVRLVHKVQ